MKRSLSTFFVAALTGIISWPLLIVNDRPLDTSCPAVEDAWIRIEEAGRLFHDLKNLLTELFRCDPLWWAKFASFTWALSLILIVVLLVMLAMRGAGK